MTKRKYKSDDIRIQLLELFLNIHGVFQMTKYLIHYEKIGMTQIGAAMNFQNCHFFSNI